MRPVERILIATDFSDCSTRAVAYGAELAAVLRAPVVLVHALVPVLPIAGPEGYVPQPPPDDTEQLLAALDRVRAHIRGHGVAEVDAVMVHGPAAQEIVKTAVDRHCDLIVMGTHGRRGLSHLILGSVAEDVVRRANCPVVTVNRRAAQPPR